MEGCPVCGTLLRRAHGITAVAVITLALGIGANTAIFSVVASRLMTADDFKTRASVALVSEGTSAKRIAP